MANEGPVVVVGAGLVGLACAYYRAAESDEPLIIDAKAPGAGSSSGNAGWIAFAQPLLAPVPGPGVVRTSLRWLVQRHSPLRLVPRLDREYVHWLLRFMASCSPEAAAAGLRATIEFNVETGALFDALKHEGLDFELEQAGCLIVHRSKADVDAARMKLDDDEDAKVLNREEAVEVEPLLRPDACAGAVLYARHLHLKPEALIAALLESLVRRGVEVRHETPCLGLERAGEKVVGVRTPAGTIRGRAVVLATGASMPSLAKQVGARVPVQAGRGYSFDVLRDKLPVGSPVYVYDHRLALTPFRDSTRVAGMMELGARRATVPPRAIEAMNRAGAATFHSWPDAGPASAWAGLRPMTPDGLPVIGPIAENVYVAGGHGMLGVTLSLRTGKAIAGFIADGALGGPVLWPFSPARFR